MKRTAAVVAAFAAVAFAQVGGEVSGRVVSTLNGEPVPGATVTLHGLGEGTVETYITETGADGRFMIRNIVPGMYEALPSKAGFEQRMPNRVATAAFPPLDVTVGKPLGPVELRLIPEGAIAGRVVDSEGDPVARVSIRAATFGYVNGKKQLRDVRAVQTDDRGKYRLYYLPPDRYYIFAAPTAGGLSLPGGIAVRSVWIGESAPERGLAASYYPGAPDAAHATALDLPPGGELDGIDMRLAEESLYSIRGRVLSPDWATTGFSVMVQRAGGNGVGAPYATRVKDDAFEASALPPGKYIVTARRAPRRPNPGAAQEFAVQTVEVVDRDVERVDLTFLPAISIKGSVRIEGVIPPNSSLRLNLDPADARLVFNQTAPVAADGTFELQAEPGKYRLRLFGPPLYVKSVLVGKEVAPGGVIDTVKLDGNLTVLVSANFASINGRVLDDAGKPVFNADVTLIPDQSEDDWQQRFRNALTKADGTFSLGSLTPGDYKLFAWLGVEQGAPQDADFRKPFESRGVAVKLEPNGRQTVELHVIRAPE